MWTRFVPTSFYLPGRARSGGYSVSDEIWLDTWASVFNLLSYLWDSAEIDRKEIARRLRDADLAAMIADQVGSDSWVKYYEVSPAVSFSKLFLNIFGVRFGFELLRDVTVATKVVLSGEKPNLRPPSRDLPPNRVGTKLMALRAWNCQLQAILAFDATMSELLRRGRVENDDLALKNAIRIDPAVLGGTTVANRMSRAIAINDMSCVASMLNAAENPIVGERQNARLYAALKILGAAKQLHFLNEHRAAALFIERTRLYPTHGRKDPHRSLWRQVQRWRRKHATQSS